MGGSVVFNDHSMKLAYGEEASVLADKRVAGIQALSGTGACRLFADFQRRFKPESHIFIPVPTWAKYASSDDLHSLHVVPSEQTNVVYTIVVFFFFPGFDVFSGCLQPSQYLERCPRPTAYLPLLRPCNQGPRLCWSHGRCEGIIRFLFSSCI